jgi:hypothetical protein
METCQDGDKMGSTGIERTNESDAGTDDHLGCCHKTLKKTRLERKLYMDCYTAIAIPPPRDR